MIESPLTFAPPSMFRYHIHNWTLKLTDDWLLDMDTVTDHIVAVCTECGKVLSRSEIEGRMNHDN